MIEITHIDNPHLFWFKYKNVVNNEFNKFEEILQTYSHERCENPSFMQRRRGIHVNDIVSTFHSGKWIRCKVNSIDKSICLLWSIDYGFLLSLPKTFLILVDDNEIETKTFSMLFKAAISSIVPIHGISQEWSQSAIEDFKLLIGKNGDSLDFQSTGHVQDLLLGELNYINGNVEVNISKTLIQMSRAQLKDKSFVKTFLSKKYFGIIESNEIDNLKENKITCKTDQNSFFAEKKKKILRIIEAEKEIINSNSNEKIVKENVLQKQSQFPYETMQYHNKDDNSLDKNSVKSGTFGPPLPIDILSEPSSSNSLKNASRTQRRTQQKHKKLRFGETSTIIVDNKNKTNGQTHEECRKVEKININTIGEPQHHSKIDLGRILVQSTNKINPLSNIQEANFTSDVHRALQKLKLQETYVTQAYTWQHLMRGNSLVLIDSKFRGKTISYLPALCSLLQMHLDGANNEEHMGVYAIILCSNSSSVEKTAQLCRKLLTTNTYKAPKVVHSIGTRSIASVVTQLFNGCNVLVTTMTCLLALLEFNENLLLNKHMSFVFDNIDMLAKQYGFEKIELIFEKCCLKNPNNMKQVIITARTWQSNIRRIIPRIENAALIFGNFVEAAIYGKLNIKLIIRNDNKIDSMFEQLNSINYIKEKTIIFCNQKDECNLIAKQLNSRNIKNHVWSTISRERRNREYFIAEQFWQLAEGILILSDETFNELNIRNAENVIHYSLPETYLNFIYRFSSSINFYENILNGKKSSNNPCAIIIVDEINNHRLPNLIDLVQRAGVKLPVNIINISANIRAKNKQLKAERHQHESICNFLFMHGHENHESKCHLRHLFIPSDLLTEEQHWMPKNGLIRLSIHKIHSPTHYTVRLLEQQHASVWMPVCQSNEYARFRMEMGLFYNDEKSHVLLSNVNQGDLCMLMIDSKPQRGFIVKRHEKEILRPVNDFDVDVQLIDLGKIITKKSTDLFILDEQFCTFPRQAIDMHLIGLIPADSEDEWDSEITKFLEKEVNKFKSNELEHKIEANIVFALQNACAVDCIRITKRHKDATTIKTSFKTFMESNMYGVLSQTAKKNIIKMARELGVVMPNPNMMNDDHKGNSLQSNGEAIENKTDNQIDEKSNQNLNETKSENIEHIEPENKSDKNDSNYEIKASPTNEMNIVEEENSLFSSLSINRFYAIEIRLFYSPKTFYVREDDLKLNELRTKIDCYINNKSIKKIPVEEPLIGNFCLANIGDYYYRAKIVENRFNSDGFYVKIFCCDDGLFHECNLHDIIEIPLNIIEFLPFQAIYCSLDGLEPPDQFDDWTETMIDEIFDILDSYNDIYAKVRSTEIVPNRSVDLIRYNVTLINGRAGNSIDLCQILVDKNLAKYKNGYIVRKINDNIDTSDEENWDNEIDPNKQNPWKTPSESDNNEDTFDVYTPNDLLNDIEYKMKNEAKSIKENNNKITQMNILRNIYKSSQITWRQTDLIIHLKIQACDKTTYELKVIDFDQVIICVKNENEIFYNVLHLFAAIDAKLTSHEILGQHIVVRLCKLVPHIDWPRLLFEKEHNIHIKYDGEIKIDEYTPTNKTNNGINTLRRIDETYTNLEDSGSDSDNNFDDMDF